MRRRATERKRAAGRADARRVRPLVADLRRRGQSPDRARDGVDHAASRRRPGPGGGRRRLRHRAARARDGGGRCAGLRPRFFPGHAGEGAGEARSGRRTLRATRSDDGIAVRVGLDGSGHLLSRARARRRSGERLRRDVADLSRRRLRPRLRPPSGDAAPGHAGPVHRSGDGPQDAAGGRATPALRLRARGDADGALHRSHERARRGRRARRPVAPGAEVSGLAAAVRDATAPQLTMVLELIALLCTGIFAGAAIYISAVEHPARIECGIPLALAQFRPSYRRAAAMQATLAAIGCLSAVSAWAQGRGALVLLAGILLGAVIPFTLVVILPTNKRLLAPGLAPGSVEAAALLVRWGRLHAVRSAASSVSFVLLGFDLVQGSLR